MSSLLLITFFLLFAITMIGAVVGLRVMEAQRRKRVGAMLDTVANEALAPQAAVLIERTEDGSQRLMALISKLNIAARIERRIQQSGLPWDLPKFLGASAVAGVVGLAVGYKLRVMLATAPSMLLLGAAFALLPWAYLGIKRNKRLAQFEEQFPEALDFMARALRAGHAFPTTLEMLSTESSEPLRAEFLRTYNEHHLGEAIPVALRHLADRVPLLDLRFFVSAVLMQREAGGNLGEILTNLAHVIRERFQLKGKVNAVSAHGRLTAKILTFLPVMVALALMAMRPEYLMKLVTQPEGKYLITFAVINQTIGYFIISRIVKIKV